MVMIGLRIGQIDLVQGNSGDLCCHRIPISLLHIQMSDATRDRFNDEYTQTVWRVTQVVPPAGQPEIRPREVRSEEWGRPAAQRELRQDLRRVRRSPFH